MFVLVPEATYTHLNLYKNMKATPATMIMVPTMILGVMISVPLRNMRLKRMAHSGFVPAMGWMLVMLEAESAMK